MIAVNKPIRKKDGMGLTQGKPAYTDDLAPKDALIVKALRSPHAYAKILYIDTSLAEKMPEIKCILTYKNVPNNLMTRAGQGYPEPSPYDKKILDNIVRYVGDAVAVVAGTNIEAVEKAMEKIIVKYEIYKPVLSFEDAKDNPIKVHDNDGTFEMFNIGHFPKRNLAASYSMEIGDVKKELNSSDIVYEGTYYTQAQAHAMTEPHSSTAYLDYQERLNIITSTQTPFHVRRILSRTLNMSMEKIRIFKPRVGGGYGGKQAIHGEIFVSLVTIMTGLPSKYIYTRREVFESTYTRHAMRVNVKIGAMSNGTIRVIDMSILSNTGAYGEHALTVLMVAGSKTLPLYNHVKAVGFSGDVVYTNLTPAGAYRGYGAIQGNFALESAIDELAEKLNINPVEFRQMNMIKEMETSKVFEVMGEGKEGTPMIVESCKLDTCLNNVLEKSNWKEKYPYVEVDENTVRSVGLAIAMQGSGIPHIDMASASIKLNDFGSFNLTLGATDIGTGSDTILAQIAAEVLKVPTDIITVYSSDTDRTPFDVGAYASSTTYISGNSVRIAAEKMVDEILRVGKEHFNTDKISYDGEYIYSEDDKISLVDLSTILTYSENQQQLQTIGSYVAEKAPPPYMAAVAEIEINKQTGQYKILNYYASVDCGTTINPNLARIQVEGGILQGIGMACYEEATYTDKGRLINSSFMKYRIPTREDIGEIHVEFVESYEPSGPFGAKSVGEIGIDTPPAAIANAIKNAMGVRIDKLPIKAEDIWMKKTTSK
ncbi:MAG: molybdopterin-dependent oxidoreductase [Clostridiales bacterium]|nr:molybdopterin-dependent oxidoreductase [Clostridiales bacterium]